LKKLLSFQNIVSFFSETSHVCALVSLVIMMSLTCVDVVLRYFGHPIFGTYEIVGYLGLILVSLGLAHATSKKVHIAVEILVSRLPKRAQVFVNSITCFFCVCIFSTLAWETFLYAGDLQRSGQVSLSLQFPFFLLAYVMTFSFVLVSGVFVLDLIKLISATRKKQRS